MYQIDPLSPLQSGLPTMYDLPSEDHTEPGLPDEFHTFQPQLLRETFQSSLFPPDEVFIGTDINLYYDVRHTQWHKRPDWFAVLGVSRAVQQADLRWSYVDSNRRLKNGPSRNNNERTKRNSNQSA
jgi:Uma2 family endonuclease